MVDKDTDSAFSSYVHNGDLSLNDPNDHSSNNKVPSSSSNTHSSSVPPLAPLEYLQSQRRGSITDPSFHTSLSSSSRPSNPTAGSFSIPSDLLSTPHGSPSKRGSAISHPTSPPAPVGGPAMSTVPSLDRSQNAPSSSDAFTSTRVTTTSPPKASFDTGNAFRVPESDPAQDVNPEQISAQTQADASVRQEHIKSIAPSVISQGTHAQARGPGSPSPSSKPHGTKRKLSHDRSMSIPAGEDIDPQLIGPGVPSTVNVDMEGPVPKRRGSLADTQRNPGLNTYDRRNSLDARVAHGSPQWWGNERRDSTSSMFSSPSMGYGSPAFSADSPHGRTPGGTATFAWHATQAPDQPSSMHNEGDASGPGRPFDPSSVPPITMVSSLAFNADRRMSVPTNLPSNMPPANSTTARVLRSRSRPPSRSSQLRAGESPPAAGTSTSALPSGRDADSGEVASGSSTQNFQLSAKEAGTTPYSRSPELRVSHKLAERKRRKEMRDLFDELRDQLPADRGMKASKWEILSKAIDFIVQLKHSHQDMGREIEMLRHELDSIRQGISPFGTGGPHPVMYGQGPHIVPGHYPPSSRPCHASSPTTTGAVTPGPPSTSPNALQTVVVPECVLSWIRPCWPAVAKWECSRCAGRQDRAAFIVLLLGSSIIAALDVWLDADLI
ncbi:hypothetical protein EW146_g5685 [Bondarzewia mesenterica]|uniref:BHLH domain-containing protein n=1 Tax=Bondarzewia mesenterica TaxID=1095465 RepID=A0A4S4LST7_9AGAM|nr:hypothetical protein EW146_g5685 [Bondarzewia mesenterica]